MRITAVIPCYNEGKYIADVVRETRKYVDRVIVIDNMSTDRTAEIVGDMFDPMIDCWICYKKGAGAATRLGIAYALNPKPAVYADIIVTLDGDGQHDPAEIPSLVKPIQDNRASLVIGSRFMKEYKIEKYRKLGIDIITFLYNFGSIREVTDAQSCFRAFTRDVAKKVNIEEAGFGYSTEFLIKARAMCFRIEEVPISCIYHEEFKENSTLNPIKHGFNVAMKTIKWRLKEELTGSLVKDM